MVISRVNMAPRLILRKVTKKNRSHIQCDKRANVSS